MKMRLDPTIAERDLKTKTFRAFIKLPDRTRKDRKRKADLLTDFVRFHRSDWTGPSAFVSLATLYSNVADTFLDAYGSQFPAQHSFYETEVLAFVLSVVAKEQYILGVTVWCPRDVLEQHCVAIPLQAEDGEPIAANKRVIDELSVIAKLWQLARLPSKETPADKGFSSESAYSPGTGASASEGSAGEHMEQVLVPSERSASEPFQPPQDEMSASVSSDGGAVQLPPSGEESAAKSAVVPLNDISMVKDPARESVHQRPRRLPRSITNKEEARRFEEFLIAKRWTLGKFSSQSKISVRTLNTFKRTGKVGFESWNTIEKTMSENPIVG